MRAELARLREALRLREEERRASSARVEEERRRAERRPLRAGGAPRGLPPARRGAAGRSSGGHAARWRPARRARPDPHAAEPPGERARGRRADHPRVRSRASCLIQGSYAFYDESGRPLRYRIDDGERTCATTRAPPVTRPTRARAPSTPSTTSAPASWWTGAACSSPTATWPSRGGTTPPRSARGQGYTPRFVHLPRVLPAARRSPSTRSWSGSRETIDLALLRIDLRGARIPVLPLDAAATGAVAGQPVVVVGYPTGLEAILAKAESGVVKRDPASHGTRLRARDRGALSRQGLIRPSTTQGHIGDITDSDIVFDAPTTQGGSGGAVFNSNGAGDRGGVRGAPEVRRQLVRRADRLRARAAAPAPRKPVAMTLPCAPGPAGATWRSRCSSPLVAAPSACPASASPRRRSSTRSTTPRPRSSTCRESSPTEWVHPPTAKLLIAVGVWFFGYDPWAWRLAAGARGHRAGARLLPARAARAAPRERAALLAAVAAARDGVYLVQSRIAMTNIFAVLFQLAAALVRAARAAGASRCPGAAWRGGPVPGPGPLHALDEPVGRGLPGPRAAGRCAGRRLLRAARAGARGRSPSWLLPVALYVLSYVALACGSSGPIALLPSSVARTRTAIWAATTPTCAPRIPTSASGTRGRGCTGRPGTTTSRTGTTVRGIVAIGNPALWWVVGAGDALGARHRAARARPAAGSSAAPASAASTCRGGSRPRTLNYSHYLFEAIPYACLSLGLLLDRAWDGRDGLLRAGRTWSCVVLALFLFFLPFLMALPVPA